MLRCRSSSRTRSSAGAAYVDLSRSSPNAVVHRDGSWTVTAPGAIFGQIFCTGDYIDPEIVARGLGTAVHYAIKFQCSDPVSFGIQLGVEDFYDVGPGPGNPVTRHAGGPGVERHGISAEPYAEGFSSPCINNQNSGWEIFDRSTLGDQQKHNDRSDRVTVGCRV